MVGEMILSSVVSGLAGYWFAIWKQKEKILIDYNFKSYCLKDGCLYPKVEISNHGDKSIYIKNVSICFRNKSGSNKLLFRAVETPDGQEAYGREIKPFETPSEFFLETISEKEAKFWFREDYESCPVELEVETTRKKYSEQIPDITLKKMLSKIKDF